MQILFCFILICIRTRVLANDTSPKSLATSEITNQVLNSLQIGTNQATLSFTLSQTSSKDSFLSSKTRRFLSSHINQQKAGTITPHSILPFLHMKLPRLDRNKSLTGHGRIHCRPNSFNSLCQNLREKGNVERHELGLQSDSKKRQQLD